MKRYLWPVLWAASIFTTSCFYINNRVFAKAVARQLPTHPTTASVNSFWDVYWWVFVKGWHATEYAILFWLIRWAIPAADKGKKAFWTPILVCAVYAASDEYHQTFVKDRGGRVTDVLIDVGGVLVAAGLSYLFQTYGRSRRGQMTPPAQPI